MFIYIFFFALNTILFSAFVALITSFPFQRDSCRLLLDGHRALSLLSCTFFLTSSDYFFTQCCTLCCRHDGLANIVQVKYAQQMLLYWQLEPGVWDVKSNPLAVARRVIPWVPSGIKSGGSPWQSTIFSVFSAATLSSHMFSTVFLTLLFHTSVIAYIPTDMGQKGLPLQRTKKCIEPHFFFFWCWCCHWTPNEKASPGPSLALFLLIRMPPLYSTWHTSSAAMWRLLLK